jgi:hypothetical protein
MSLLKVQAGWFSFNRYFDNFLLRPIIHLAPHNTGIAPSSFDDSALRLLTGMLGLDTPFPLMEGRPGFPGSP